MSLLPVLLAMAFPARGRAEEPDHSGPGMEIYGFAMTDVGYNFGTSDPDWFDVVRPTKLPSSSGEFGRDGRLFFGVRQSRMGVKAWLPTPIGEIKTVFEYELFGVGVDAGQTTFRLRHAFGELGQFGAGQTWSGFMDPDVWPDSIEYWGPNGMVFFRNVQVRWMPLHGDRELSVTLERPGASADLASYNRIELENVTARFPAPDVTVHYRHSGKWGHVQLAGILRYIRWDDGPGDAFDLSGSTVGWGLNLSSVIKLSEKNAIKLQAAYGRAIQNYMNDAGDDVGVEARPNDPVKPLVGVGLPVLGILAFVDWTWSSLLSSSGGYSLVLIDNSRDQPGSAFKQGQYALLNLLFHPTDNFLVGPELQFGHRLNHSDGFHYSDFRIQVSLKYKFSQKIGARQ
jgi:hypothetical protein